MMGMRPFMAVGKSQPSGNSGVDGLWHGMSSMKWPALLRARALSPRLGMSRPALVKSPKRIISRRVSPALSISCLFFLASSTSFLLVFENFGIGIFSCRSDRFLLGARSGLRLMA
jgi:hypothetical protein